MNTDMIYIALGSNLGDSRQLIVAAMNRIEEQQCGPVIRSSLWRSEPLDCPEGSADFINAMIGYKAGSGENPGALLGRLQRLETEYGRAANQVRNSPRYLDLDIICFGNLVLHTPTLTIPHPRAQERAFVLLPLLEIAPDLIFPDSRLTAAQLVSEISTEGVVRLQE